MPALLLASLPLQLVCQLVIPGAYVHEDTNSAVNQSPSKLEPVDVRVGISATRLAALPLQLVCELLATSNPDVVTEDGTSVSPPSQRLLEPLFEDYVKFPEDQAAYKIYEKLSTWDEARDQCNSEGAHLAIPDSREKIAHIKSIEKSGTKQLHVGIHKLPGNDQWVRIDNGLSIQSVPWKSDETHLQNCAGISASDDGLVDYECALPKEYFVCEISIQKD